MNDPRHWHGAQYDINAGTQYIGIRLEIVDCWRVITYK